MNKIIRKFAQKVSVQERDKEETSNDFLNTNFQEKNQEQKSFGSIESRKSKITELKSHKFNGKNIKQAQKTIKQKISQIIKEAREFGKQQPKENIFSQYITLEDMGQFVDLIQDLQAQIKMKGNENIFLKKKINKIEKSFEEKFSLQAKEISILKEFQYDYRQKMQLQIKAMRKNLAEVEKNFSLIKAKVEQINQESDDYEDSDSQNGAIKRQETDASKYARERGVALRTAHRHLKRIRDDIAKQTMLQVRVAPGTNIKTKKRLLDGEGQTLREESNIQEHQITKIEYNSEEQIENNSTKIKKNEKGSKRFNKYKISKYN